MAPQQGVATEATEVHPRVPVGMAVATTTAPRQEAAMAVSWLQSAMFGGHLVIVLPFTSLVVHAIVTLVLV